MEHLGSSLKKVRSDLGWSLDRASKETHVSKAMLGQIERGESSPTISTLWKIATGFNVPLTSLLEPLPEEHKNAVTLLRDADELRQELADDGMLIAQTFPHDPQVSFEYFEMTLPPGYKRLSEPHSPGVIEYITVVEGSMEVLSEGQWHRLKERQSIRFNGDLPHGYRNPGGRPVVSLSVIYYPSK